jgi:hypothetical protein
MSDIKKSCKKELIKTASDRLYWYNTFGKFALSREIDDIYVLHPTSNIILVFSRENFTKSIHCTSVFHTTIWKLPKWLCNRETINDFKCIHAIQHYAVENINEQKLHLSM